MTAVSLPYDMGNAGDLVKHGVLAEFAQWWCTHERRTLRFLDPFAGRPCASPPNAEVTRTIQALPACAIRDAQPEPVKRYYGSSYVVLHAARSAHASAEVWVSDSDPTARRAFNDSPMRPLECHGFSPADGFSILDADFKGDLLLLDPFADFLPRRAAEVIPKIADVSDRIACVLFVLNLDPRNRVGQQYRSLRSQYLPWVWSLHCPKLPNRGVVGESRFEVEVVLAWRRLTDHPGRDSLRKRLQDYADLLGQVLNAKVVFSDGARQRT